MRLGLARATTPLSTTAGMAYQINGAFMNELR